MAYLYNLPNATSGIDTIAGQTVTAVPEFTWLLLLFVFGVVAIGGSSRQRIRNGEADFPAWFTIGGIASFFTALMLSLISGVIQTETLVLTLVVAIIGGIWLFLDRKQSEV